MTGVVAGRRRPRYAGRRLRCARRSRRCSWCSAAWTSASITPRPARGEDHDRADELRLGLDHCVAQLHPAPEHGLVAADAAGRYRRVPGPRVYRTRPTAWTSSKGGNAIDPEDPGNVGEAWRKQLRPVSALAPTTSRSCSLTTATRSWSGSRTAFGSRPDRPAGGPAQAPHPAHRQEPVRGDRGVSARVLQPRQRADPGPTRSRPTRSSRGRRTSARRTTRSRSGRATSCR